MKKYVVLLLCAVMMLVMVGAVVAEEDGRATETMNNLLWHKTKHLDSAPFYERSALLRLDWRSAEQRREDNRPHMLPLIGDEIGDDSLDVNMPPEPDPRGAVASVANSLFGGLWNMVASIGSRVCGTFELLPREQWFNRAPTPVVE